MPRNAVPRDGDTTATCGTAVKRWFRGFFNTLDTDSGANAPINTLQRSTAYTVGDIVYSDLLHAKLYLECTADGTTGSTEPSFTGVSGGDTVTDGTVTWTVQTITSAEAVDSGFFAKLVTNLAASTVATISSLNTNSLFYRMLSWALTASGVQYNFNNSSAWYICLGSLFGGLIIQGGNITIPSGTTSANLSCALAFQNAARCAYAIYNGSVVPCAYGYNAIDLSTITVYAQTAVSRDTSVKVIAFGY